MPSDDKREPKQRLPKTGEEIPVPKRADVLRDLRKGARVRPAPPRPKLRSSRARQQRLELRAFVMMADLVKFATT